ncbi:MAG: hypothetical protein IPI66_01760 [Chitinophagaceae bacterium]|nr:hypothetical protein [Chitinophagaceae bacterium]MBL0054909.1 hypothetical protein [Chitinophagaceae bacterium]
MEQPLNEKSSLQLIETMINRAKNNFSESGHLYLIWGIVIFICSLTQFIAKYFFAVEQTYYIWFSTWLVVIYQFIFLARKAKKERVKTYTAEIVGYVWICFVACIFIFVFVLSYQKAYASINPAILILYGMPTFLSGIILKFKPLVIGGISCWVLAVGSVFVPVDFQLLFIAAAVLLAWIIPGFLLRQKFKNQL